MFEGVRTVCDMFPRGLIKFKLLSLFTSRCGHCKALAPEWIKAASALKVQGIKL